MVAQFGSPQGSGVKSSKRSRPAACSTAPRMMSAVLSRSVSAAGLRPVRNIGWKETPRQQE